MCVGSECVAELLALNLDLSSVLQKTIDPLLALVVVDQAHGQLVLLEQERVGVLALLLDGSSELGQGILTDHTSVGEPFPVRLDAGDGSLFALVAGGLGDLASSIVLGFALLPDVKLLYALARPVEVLALDPDVAHAVFAILALSHATGGFLLSGTHGGGCVMPVACGGKKRKVVFRGEEKAKIA